MPKRRRASSLVTVVEEDEPAATAGDSAEVPTSTGGCPMLDISTDDMIVECLSSLSAADLGRIAQVCKRMVTRCIAVDGKPPEMLSIVEEAARRWLSACTAAERARVPRRSGLDSYIRLMREAEQLRQPLVFTRSEAGVTLSKGGAQAAVGPAAAESILTVASAQVMRAGKHFVEFTAEVPSEEYAVMYGVIRPTWDVENELRTPISPGEEATQDHCFLNMVDGRCYPAGFVGEGEGYWCGFSEVAASEPSDLGDRVGLLLDFDKGGITVYKNSLLIGEMWDFQTAENAKPLTGDYCWAAIIVSSGSEEAARVQIRAPPLPPAPTPEEVAEAEQRGKKGLIQELLKSQATQ